MLIDWVGSVEFLNDDLVIFEVAPNDLELSLCQLLSFVV